jgi:hypothetical protein
MKTIFSVLALLALLFASPAEAKANGGAFFSANAVAVVPNFSFFAAAPVCGVGTSFFAAQPAFAFRSAFAVQQPVFFARGVRGSAAAAAVAGGASASAVVGGASAAAVGGGGGFFRRSRSVAVTRTGFFGTRTRARAVSR